MQKRKFETIWADRESKAQKKNRAWDEDSNDPH